MQLTERRRRGLVALFVCVAALVACVRGFFTSVVPVLPDVIEAPSPRLASRVLWVVVDGLRYDTALDDQLRWMPELQVLARQGASGEASTTPITMTGVGVRAMATGMSPSLADLARNWSLPHVTDDHLFARIKARGGRAVALGNETWFQLFPETLAKATTARPGIIKFAQPVNGFDRFLTKRALELARDDSWELAVLHFGGVDNASHMWTPWSEKFRAKITEIDHDLGRIVAEMGPRTTILVTSDHGTSDRGHHGGIDPDERRTPLVLNGPGIRRGVKLDARQVDLPATVAALLGLQVPAPVEGRALVEALDLTPLQADALMASEIRRHERYAMAYAAQFSVAQREEGDLSDWLTSVRGRWGSPLVWALAMIAVAAWLFGLARGSPRVECWLSIGIVVAAIGSLVMPPLVAPAAVAFACLLVPLVPWLGELRGRVALVTAAAVIALAAAQTAALLVHTYERVINAVLRRELEVPSWIGAVALVVCAPLVWRVCRSERLSPWAAFALILAFAMPGDDAALRGMVVVGAVAAIAMWRRDDGWSLFAALGVAAAGLWIGPRLAEQAWVEVAAPSAIGIAAAFGSRTRFAWAWLVAGVTASATVATGRPMVLVFASIAAAIAGTIVLVVRRRDPAQRLALVGWGAAILLGMLSHPEDVPGLIGLVLVCDRIGRLGAFARQESRTPGARGDLRTAAFAATICCLAMRDAFVLVFEGRLAFGNLEIWLGYVAGNEHTVLGAGLVIFKFLLPFVVVLALVMRATSSEVRSLAITGCAVFFVIRLAEIVVGLCTAQGTFYGPYRDVAQLAIGAGLLVTLLVSALVTLDRTGSRAARAA